MNASGVLLFNTVLHEKFAQEVTENGYLKDLLSTFRALLESTRACAFNICKS